MFHGVRCVFVVGVLEGGGRGEGGKEEKEKEGVGVLLNRTVRRSGADFC